jgi:hypothetical protein
MSYGSFSKIKRPKIAVLVLFTKKDMYGFYNLFAFIDEIPFILHFA